MQYFWTMSFKKTVFFFFALAFSIFSIGQNSVELPQDGESMHLAAHAWILEDQEDTLTLDDII